MVARNLRILFLLLILLCVAVGTWLDRVYTTSWETPLLVALYPINADGTSATDTYIEKLQESQFQTLERFFDEERRQYDVPLDNPVRFTLAPALHDRPPRLGNRPNVLQIMFWSLRLRWWAKFSVPAPPGPTPRIRLFLMYHDPARTAVLNHSIGLQKGLVGVVNLFADKQMNGSNDSVIAHEFLHTLGATDKYDPATDLPLYPVGYAEPNRKPLYPQDYAELMAGRIPISPNDARTPTSLDQVIVGPATAVEIGWQK